MEGPFQMGGRGVMMQRTETLAQKRIVSDASNTILYGDNGIRTRDLCVANATLSQLSYVPATAVYYSAEKAETELEISDFQVPEAPSGSASDLSN